MTSSSVIESLDPWQLANVLGPAELYGAEVICRGQPDDLHVRLGAAFALWAPLHGHTCIDITELPAVVRAELATAALDGGNDSDDALAPVDLPWPQTDEWCTALGASPVCRVVSGPDAMPVLDDRPLVLNGTLLYTQRQWVDECTVAAALRARASVATRSSLQLTAEADELLHRLLPPGQATAAELQHHAARLVTSSALTVIVGGPGTGKTHTVARALAVLAADAGQRGHRLRIALAAPTGKAASRLTEAIAQATSSTAIAAPLADALAALRASTIHRLLGSRGATRFRHDASNPLPHDVVVIDEASMVALPLMARLLEALRPDAKLILVGDPDQLASIEVGSVLADIVAAATKAGSPLHDWVVRLARSHRQQAGSPIGPLADAIRENRADDAVAMLRAGPVDPVSRHSVLSFIEHADPLAKLDGAGVREVVGPPLSAALEAARTGNATEALARFASVRLLCAHRRGPFGVDEWNRRIESWLLPDAPHARPPRFYPGRPLLATRNDLRLRIANGDTGIVVNDASGGHAVFATGGELRVLTPAQLVEVETAYAMTIHKSQGSEYATVVVVLPPPTSPLLARQLLYTAVTRTTDRLVIVGTEAAVVAAVQHPTVRVSGLARAL